MTKQQTTSQGKLLTSSLFDSAMLGIRYSPRWIIDINANFRTLSSSIRRLKLISSRCLFRYIFPFLNLPAFSFKEKQSVAIDLRIFAHTLDNVCIKKSHALATSPR